MEENHQLLRKIAIFSIITSSVIFFIGTTVAIFSYPGYDFFNQFFSELGIRENIRNYKAAPHPELFNVTLMISGVLMIPFFPSVYYLLRNENIKSSIFLGLSAITGTISGPLVFLIGIFDLWTSWTLHALVATNLYIVYALTGILWNIGLIIMDPSSFYKQFDLWKDHMLSLIIIFTSIVNSFAFVPNIPVIDLISIETYQKILVYIYLLYFVLVANRLRKVDIDQILDE